MSDTIIIAIGTADLDDTSNTAENITAIVENAKTKDVVNLREDIAKGKKRLDFLLNYN